MKETRFFALILVGLLFMDFAQTIIFAIGFLTWFFAFIKLIYDHKPSKSYTNVTRFLVRIAIFGAISAVLYIVPFLKFSLIIFPSFLEIHFDEIPVFIAGFAYGPVYSIAILFIKTIIKLPFTSTLGVGELSDLIFSSAFILPATIIYKKRRTFKGAITGLLIGTMCQLLVSLIGNIYFMVPFYLFMFNLTRDQLLAICQLANPLIEDIEWKYGLYGVLPFNTIKDSIIIILTLLVYKSTHTYIDKLSNEKTAY